MVDVGRLLGQSDIELHIFGTVDSDYESGDKFVNLIQGESSIIYHGPYDGFGSIDVNEYDMLLFTSKNEGMPNILLESCKANLYIIAPDVGGVNEIVKDKLNGRLVSFDDRFVAQKYLYEVMQAYTLEEFSNEATIDKENRIIEHRHSDTQYSKDVEDMINNQGAWYT